MPGQGAAAALPMPARDGMGHIVLIEPRLDRFHLHDRLHRALRERGHRVVLACCAPEVHAFWRHQEGAADVVDAATRLLALLDAAADLVILHGPCGGAAADAAACARQTGARTLWIGDGLLPHTLQIDGQGIDDAASWTRRTAAEFEVVPVDEVLLQTSLAHALANAEPVALPRTPVRPPPRSVRLGSALRAWRHGPSGMLAAWSAWRAALPRCAENRDAPPIDLPPRPFVAVLLQVAGDHRLLATDAPVSPQRLVAAAAEAVRAVVPEAVTLVVLPPGAAQRHTFVGLPAVPANAAAMAAATAIAVVTVNHPAACVALLAGTPALLTGRSALGVSGIAAPIPPEQLATALRTALATETAPQCRHFLSWLLRHGHVWCSPTAPDHNGIQGLVQAIENRLAPSGPRLRYRSGPAWPLLP
jgi:hypothetical protein